MKENGYKNTFSGYFIGMGEHLYNIQMKHSYIKKLFSPRILFYVYLYRFRTQYTPALFFGSNRKRAPTTLTWYSLLR